MFNGRKLLIATKHQKEKVIAPILENELGVECLVAEGVDTDLLGTFSGEVDRKDDPITTLRKKCSLAMLKYDLDLAIASEGSFGIHPAVFFASADDELLLLIDKKNNLEVLARELSTETNFDGRSIVNEFELKSFADQVKFPSHALIIRKSKDDFSEISKGITDWITLSQLFQSLMSKYGQAYVETDMRAMFNPTRMEVIKNAVEKLVANINSLCPQCKTPGFVITQSLNGLPCSICDLPTRATLSHIYTCQKCSYTHEKMYPNNKYSEDPMYCDFCNP